MRTTRRSVTTLNLRWPGKTRINGRRRLNRKRLEGRRRSNRKRLEGRRRITMKKG